MTNYLALILFGVAFAFGLVGAVLAVLELPGRLRALGRQTPPEPELPMSFNEHLDAVRAILAGRTPQVVLAQTRGAFNELIGALGDEVAVRGASDRRLAELMGVPSGSRRLLLAIVSVVAAAVFGGLGDLVATLEWHPGQNVSTHLTCSMRTVQHATQLDCVER